MAKFSFTGISKFIFAIALYIVANKYVVGHLQLFVGEFFNSNLLVITYWILSLITLIMMIPLHLKTKPVQVFIKFVGRRFLEVLISLTITYVAIDLLYLVCELLNFDKRSLVEYISGITFFVVVGVVMFGNLNLSNHALKICSRKSIYSDF